MRCLSVSALIVALAAPAGASTLTHSFDIRVTPTALGFYGPFDDFIALNPKRDADRIAAFTPGSCRDIAGDGDLFCSFRDLPLDDLQRFVASYGSTIVSTIQLAPVIGRITFDGTGYVGCTGDLGRLISACGRQGGVGIPDVIGFGPSQSYSEASHLGFKTAFFEGEGLIERIGPATGSRQTEGSANFGFLGLSFSTNLGYYLGSKVEYFLDDESPVYAPSPVPLPATLPLLLGALSGAGALGRRKARMARDG